VSEETLHPIVIVIEIDDPGAGGPAGRRCSAAVAGVRLGRPDQARMLASSSHDRSQAEPDLRILI